MRDSESSTEDDIDVDMALDKEAGDNLQMDIDVETEAGVDVGSENEGMVYGSSASGNEDEFAHLSQSSGSLSGIDGLDGDGNAVEGADDEYGDTTSEVSFPDDDAWNQYDEDEELDAEVSPMSGSKVDECWEYKLEEEGVSGELERALASRSVDLHSS
jgi:hypothetical protein